MSDRRLMAMLADFQEKRNTLSSSSEDVRALELSNLFKPIAKKLLYGGCFEVYSNGKIVQKVYPYTVEFYYHEETAGGFKDYIMYHRNKITAIDGKEIKNVPYFKRGSINAHQSGIDITFESKKDQYRASVLIRAFKFEKKGEEITDTRSTYLYDQLLTGLEMPITIQWKDYASLSDINPEQGFRVNGFLLKPNPDGCGKPIKEKDRRPWAFSVKAFRPSLRYDPEKAE